LPVTSSPIQIMYEKQQRKTTQGIALGRIALGRIAVGRIALSRIALGRISRLSYGC